MQLSAPQNGHAMDKASGAHGGDVALAQNASTIRGWLAGAAVSFAVHGALVGAWLSRQPPAPTPESVAIDVALVDLAEPEPRRPENTPELTTATATAAASSLSIPTGGPRKGVAAVTSNPEGGGGAIGPAQSPDAIVGLGQALDARRGCLEADSRETRERCAERLASATGAAGRETNRYVRIGDQVALMAQVRRAENTAERMSCERTRNFDPDCPNTLPDNKPDDYILTREP